MNRLGPTGIRCYAVTRSQYTARGRFSNASLSTQTGLVARATIAASITWFGIGGRLGILRLTAVVAEAMVVTVVERRRKGRERGLGRWWTRRRG